MVSLCAPAPLRENSNSHGFFKDCLLQSFGKLT